MDLNSLYRKYPHLFQFMIDDFEISSEKEEGEEREDIKARAVFEKLNSNRKFSYPFYKPISKIITLEKDESESI